MAKKKLDLSSVKQMLINKGERLGLAICAVVALALVGLGLAKAASSGGTNWAQQLKQKTDLVKESVAKGNPSVEPIVNPPLDELVPPWPETKATFVPNAWSVNPDRSGKQRINPVLVNIAAKSDDPKQIQADVIFGGVYHNELDLRFNQVKGYSAGQTTAPIAYMEPMRLIVVQSIFPMREQVYEYSRALGIPMNLLGKENMPHPLGLDVVKMEIVANKDGTWKLLSEKQIYEVDAKDKWLAKPKAENKELVRFLKEMVVDTRAAQALGSYAYPEGGLAMPLPLLANGSYPPIKLDDYDPAVAAAAPMPAGAAPNMPGVPGPAPNGGMPNNPPTVAKGTGTKITMGKWPKELTPKYEGKLNIFDPMYEQVAKGIEERKGGAAPAPVAVGPTRRSTTP